MSSVQIEPPFGQGVGYGIVVGVGAAFAIGMSALSWFLSKYFAEKQDSEMFMTAKHSVKTGLTASAVVSSWTIAATLLTSTSYGYQYGVSGPFWYGAGASVQILLFSIVAIELKRNAPGAQTFLQVAKHRYGAAAHIVLTCYSLLFQCLTTVALLVGGGAVFNLLTGANQDALNFLFPIGVVIYTLCGGIKATFLTDWLHTVVIFIVMLTSAFIVYATSDVIGSSDRMWDLLTTASSLHPVSGNAEGSYMTMRSQEGGYIGLIFVGSGFAAAVDSQLFQKAIAADPASTLAGYLLGGTSWFTVPFVLASTFGLTAAATEHLSSFPTYPNRMNSYEVSSGLAMPYAALSVMGNGGAFAVLLMVFMAVTSAMSSETVATTALLTYNFYHAYFNPKATGKQLLRFSNITVPLFAIFAACVATGLNHAGFSVSFLITVSGILVDSAIVPMACTIMWRKQSRFAVIASPVISSVAGILAWLLTARSTEGAITIETLSTNLPLVAGNICSLCAPLVLTPLFTFIHPEDYDFEKFKEIRPIGELAEEDPLYVPPTQAELEIIQEDEEKNDKILLRARSRAIWASIAMTLCFLILWPVPMYASSYVFSKGFLKGWVIFVFLWAFFATSVITLLPIWESRDSLVKFARFVVKGKITKDGGDDCGIIEGVPSDTKASEGAQEKQATGKVQPARKKCDETYPICGHCLRLNLVCVREEPVALSPEGQRGLSIERTPSYHVPMTKSRPQASMVCLGNPAPAMSLQPACDTGQRYLLKYYTQVLSMLCTTNVLGNSFLNVFMPMALESPSVLRSILAWAAKHLSGFQEGYESTALCHGSAALQCLASELRDTLRYETNLASCLILSAAASPTNQWYSHLEGAKTVIETAVATGPGGKTLRGADYFKQSADGQWLLRDFSYHDVLGAVAMGCEPLLKGTYWLPENGRVLDACMGLASPILGLLSEICCLRLDSAITAQLEAGQDTCKNCGSRVGYRSWPPFVDIESRLRNWTCADGQPEDLIDLAESHRLTALVCLYRKGRTLFPHESADINLEITRLVGQLIQSIEKIPYQSLAEGGLIFPTFIAGGDAPDETSMASVRARMNGLLGHRGFRHIALALDVLEELWRLKLRKTKNANGLDIDWRDIVDKRKIKLMLH